MNRKPKDTPVINIPEGYQLEEMIDTDDSGYDFEYAILYEEVKVSFERDKGE